jgi:hypothetical protein
VPKISTYPTVTPADSDLIPITDASDSSNTKNVTIASLRSALSFAYTEIHDASGLETTSANVTPVILNVGTSQGATNDVSLQQNNSGRVTNTGASRTFAVTFSVSASAANNNQLEFSLAKNGTVIPYSQTDSVTAAGGKGVSVSNTIIVTLNTNEYVEVFLAAPGGALNPVTLQHLNLFLKQI